MEAIDKRPRDLLDNGTWQERLEAILALMREMSVQTDPQEMVRIYANRLGKLRQMDRRVSVSRRGLSWPEFRVTRFSEWSEERNPWKEKSKLPIHRGGILADMLYSNRAEIVHDLQLDPNDPAAPYLEGMRSVVSLPMFDQGESLNMTVLGREQPSAFDVEQFPEMVWLTSLFGRATSNLVTADELKKAHAEIDDEQRTIAELQRSLLPKKLPKIKGVEFATHYRTSRDAGGDYYDIFPIDDQRFAILIADVSGHGSPAAVIMAVTHAIAHMYDGPPLSPGARLEHLNKHLTARYTGAGGAFVTAFVGVYDAAKGTLTYSSAGHNPPRVKSCSGGVRTLTGAGSVPLGISDEFRYPEATTQLKCGDEVVFYTDGIVEAMSPTGELFGVERLDQHFGWCASDKPSESVESLLAAVDAFSGVALPADDQTLVVMRVGGNSC